MESNRVMYNDLESILYTKEQLAEAVQKRLSVSAAVSDIMGTISYFSASFSAW